jgi:predicted DNA-binding transcriptional regulator AlpA
VSAKTLITYEALAAKGIHLSKSQLWKLEKKGKFPLRVALSAQRHAWLEHEIDALIASRIACRQPAAA